MASALCGPSDSIQVERGMHNTGSTLTRHSQRVVSSMTRCHTDWNLADIEYRISDIPRNDEHEA